ncbi:hypothetical protein SteCoe_27832 [Stentor coeruleus]|uniref:RING-type domain-containing protein n=1 Tax=Stentor coeruleus TaxID=5963 RepID=A0A1R2B9M9_9CILI|nr:hypothetical protein SteCoe_27832 [Stentor coeruleus]
MVRLDTFMILLSIAWGKCNLCSTSGNLWWNNYTTNFICPYSSTCDSGCYKCINDNIEASCIDSSVVINCITNIVNIIQRTCSSSYYSKSSGGFRIKTPLEVLCYWQLDLRLFNKYSDQVEISLSNNTTLNDMVFILVYNIPYTDGIPFLRNYIGSLYTLKKSYIKVQGNYIVISFWRTSQNNVDFSLKWTTGDSNDSNSKLYLILSVFLPCVGICCCALCIYSFYRKKISRRIRPNVPYQVMNCTEHIDDSYIEEQIPAKYFLTKEKIICPICFDKYYIYSLTLGDQIRETFCKHVFHSKCIEEWIESKPLQYVCPVCKTCLFDIGRIGK